MAIRERIRKLFLLRGNVPALVANRLVDSTGWNMMETIWQPYALSLGASMPVLGSFIFEAHGFWGAVLASLLCSLMAVALSFGIKPLNKVT